MARKWRQIVGNRYQNGKQGSDWCRVELAVLDMTHGCQALSEVFPLLSFRFALQIGSAYKL